MKIFCSAASLAVAFITLSARAQIQTLAVGPGNTNSPVITVSSNSYAVIRSSFDDYGAHLLVNVQGVNFNFYTVDDNVSGLVFAGPATMQLQGNAYGPALVTVEVKPGPYPPGKTLTVGAYSGNVQVTMQTSTDLVNWTPAVNGMVYTNSPDARFFRIQMVTNAQGP